MKYIPIVVTLVLLVSCSSERSEPVQKSGGSTDSDAIRPLSTRDSVSLRYLPVPGTKLSCSARQDDVLDFDSVHMRVVTELFFTQIVEHAGTDGSIKLRMRYDSIAIDQRYWESDSSQVQIRRFRSTDPMSSRNADYAVFTAAIGQNISATIAPNGTIESISGIEPIIRKLLGQQADSLNAEQRRVVEQQLQSELYGQVLIQQFLLLPTSALDSTHSWSRTVEQAFPPAFIARATARYRLEGVQLSGGDSLLVIGAVLDGTIRPEPAADKLGVTVRTGTVRGTATGALSRQHGLMLRRRNVIEYQLHAEAKDRSGKTHQLSQRKRTSFQFAARVVEPVQSRLE
ncbi:MAG: DUF6263 family protein [Chlorobi bacterium]|nr:DUF6263 family protein [Chlorobiota bacterium]